MNMRLLKSATPEEPRPAVSPEEHFQNPFAAIDPMEMSMNVLARTIALVSTLKAGAFSDATFSPDQLGYALDQVEANLNMLEWTLENLVEEATE